MTLKKRGNWRVLPVPVQNSRDVETHSWDGVPDCAHAAVGVQDTWCHQKWRDGRTPQKNGRFTHGKADAKILLV